VEREPASILAYCMMGRLYASQNQQGEAETAFQKACELHRSLPASGGQGAQPWLESGWWVTGPARGDPPPDDLPEKVPSPFRIAAEENGSANSSHGDWPWTPVEPDGGGYVDLQEFQHRTEAPWMLAVELIYSAAEQEVALLVGSGSTIRVWLEDEPVFERVLRNTTRVDEQAVSVTLRPGWNKLLVLIVDQGRPFGMSVHVSNRAIDLARAHIRQGNLEGVIKVWHHANEIDRAEPSLLALAGESFARRGNWREAATAFRQLVSRQPVRNRNWVMLAPLLVQLHETHAYRQHCKAMIAAFGEANLPITLERSAKACLLVPDEPAHLRAPAYMAAQAASIGENQPFLAFFRLAEGMGQFRIGNYTQACQILEDAMSINNDRDPYLAATSGFFLAMALYQRQLQDEARQQFEKANATFSQRLSAIQERDLGPAWSDWLVCSIAQREAATMLGLPANLEASVRQ
jgi:tetratricopeptide (TPR) repeat protein